MGRDDLPVRLSQLGRTRSTGAGAVDLTHSYNTHIPIEVLERYSMVEVRNASAVLRASNPGCHDDIINVVDDFVVRAADITVPGGNRGPIPIRLDGAFDNLGWKAVRINTEFSLIGKVKGARGATLFESSVASDGFEVDNMKDRVALDVEWNAKDGNLDRDLSAYRALYDVGLIDAAVIICRDFDGIMDLARIDLQDEDAMRRMNSTTTTTIQKLTPRLTRGDAGGCPVLGIGITRETWDAQ